MTDYKSLAFSVFNKLMGEVHWRGKSRWLISVDYLEHIKIINEEIIEGDYDPEYKIGILEKLKGHYINYFSDPSNAIGRNDVLFSSILEFVNEKIKKEEKLLEN